jgi:hypothetical protein
MVTLGVPAMTQAQAFALIKDSAPYKAAGNLEGAYIRWRAANPGEATRLSAYLDARIRGQNPATPALATKFGLGVLGLLGEATEPQPEPPPSPPVSTFWDQHFAIVITAGNIDPQLLWDAGVRAVAFDVTAANTVEAQSAGWARFVRGWFFITRATTAAGLIEEAIDFSQRLNASAIDFAVVDTENLKADFPNQERFELQRLFYAALRARTAKLLANITYGWHQDGSVVNYQALADNRIEPWWEAYNGDEASWNTAAVTAKLNAQGFNPARICLGDKRLEQQVPVWKMLVAQGKAAKGAMLWSPDNGPAQEALRNGVKLA